MTTHRLNILLAILGTIAGIFIVSVIDTPPCREGCDTR